jgi:hypothetical protein
MPRLQRYARLGTVLKRSAGAVMIALVVFQFVSCAVIKAKGGGGGERYSIYGAVFQFCSWRTFLLAMGLGSASFWARDHLERTY